MLNTNNTKVKCIDMLVVKTSVNCNHDIDNDVMMIIMVMIMIGPDKCAKIIPKETRKT
jgi:hypothetical protein